MPAHDPAVGGLQAQHVIPRRHAAPLGQDGQGITAPGHRHAHMQLRIDQLRPEIPLHLLEEDPFLLARDGSVKFAFPPQARFGEFRPRNGFPVPGQNQPRLFAQQRIPEIAVVNLHELLVPGRPIGDLILHRHRGAGHRNPDRAPVFQHMADDEIEKITLEIASQKQVTPRQKAAVLSEFYQMAMAKNDLSTGGLEYAQNVL